MKLLVVMRADSPLIEHRGADDVLLPASASALLALQDRGVAFETISGWLRRDDYRAIWQESLATCWRLVDAGRVMERPDQPDLGLIYAYSVFLALSQVQVMARGLTRRHDARAFSEIVVETPHAGSTVNSVYWEGPSLYLEVIRAWAAASGIGCSVVATGRTPAVSSLEKARTEAAAPVRGQISLSRVAASLSWRSQAAARQLGAAWSFVKRLGGPLRLLARGPRKGRSNLVLFYSQHLGLNDPQHIPANAFDVRWVSDVLSSFAIDARPVLTRSMQALEMAAANLVQCHGWIGRIVKERLMTSAAVYGADNIGLFRIWLAMLRRLRSTGWQATLMADMPYTNFSPIAMVVEAFRCGKGLVAEVCHSASYSLGQSSGCPTGLAVGPADLLFHWGRLGSGEVGDRLLSMSNIRHVRTGSVRSHVLRSRAAPARRVAPDEAMVLYAPTLLCQQTMHGANVAWDRYLPVLDVVLGAFARASFRTVVSYLNVPEMACVVERWRSSPIEFRPHSFSHWLPEADYVVVDSLGGSPIYEALTTDKPILCYTATEMQEWDAQFMAALRRRVVCCEDAPSYLACVDRLAADPAGFFAADGRTRSDELLQMVAPPTPEEDFWKIVGTSVVEMTADRVASNVSRGELRGSGRP